MNRPLIPIPVVDVSIIVPVFNAASTLEACLDALGRQDAPLTREILVVDNNSTDASAEIARRHPLVRLLAEPKQSAYAARNRALAEATGRVLAFTDGDCVARPDWLRRLVARLGGAGVEVVMGRDRPAGTTAAVRLLAEYDHVKESWVLGHPNPAIYYGHTNNLAARREAFAAVGAFDESPRGSDVVFVQRVLARFGVDAVQYAPDAVVDHLEIDRASAYFRKAFVYGKSARRYSTIVPARPLGSAERLRIFRETVIRCGLSPTQAGHLFMLLVAGVSCYYAGWYAAARPGSAAHRAATNNEASA